jgi:hypothetical protein
LDLKNSYQIRALNKAYRFQYKKGLLEVINSEFSRHIEVLLKTIMQAHLDPVDYFAARIYKAFKRSGINDSLLIGCLIL